MSSERPWLPSMRADHYRIGQVGVHHYPRLAGHSTDGSLKVIFRAFGELFRLRHQILAGSR